MKRLSKEKPLITRDLFTGELRPLVLKAGNGHHVRLRRDLGEPVAFPGMAHFEGSGPKGVTCRACRYLVDIEIKPADGEPWKRPRTERDACAKARALMGGIVQPGGLGQRAGCKYFAPNTTESDNGQSENQGEAEG